MSSESHSQPGFFARARSRGVLRVAASYAVIAWLLLQIADVTFDPLGIPKWVMTALIIAAALGLPIALTLAWFYELGDAGVSRDTASAEAVRPTVHGARRYADLAIIGVLLVVVAVLLVRESGIGKPPPPAHPTIAVLPFVNLSADPEQEYFSDGLAEEMLDRLGRVPGLMVVARSTSFSFKGKGLDAKSIAERLGVTTVLEGSIRRDQNRLRLTARLIDGATGKQAWSGSFDRELTDIFAVQAELAAAVVEAIIPSARGDAALSAKPLTNDIGAYDLYLLARSRVGVRNPFAIREAVEYAERAVRLDPEFARAQAVLGNALLYRVLYDSEAQDEEDVLLRRAEAAIYRALALDPDLSEAHAYYANLLRHNGRPGAEDEYKRALELNPNNAVAWHDYGVYLGNVAGRAEESAAAIERSLALDPRSTPAWVNYIGRLVAKGDEAAIVAAYDRAIPLLADVEGGLGQVIITAFLAGRPVETLKASLIAEKSGAGGFQPAWIGKARAWAFVDLDRSAQALGGVNEQAKLLQTVLIYMKLDDAGLRGDFARLEALLAELGTLRGAAAQEVHSVRAFWLAVQGRYEEAASSLERAEPLPVRDLPFRFGGSLDVGQMLAAKLRILRNTGRVDEARVLLDESLARLRKERSRTDGLVDSLTMTALAGVAAEAGLEDEAVDALRAAMGLAPLPLEFRPELPWFRALEGQPPYDELLRERERRVQKIKADMIRLESPT